MAVEKIGDVVKFEPGPFDVHTHPRIFDVRTDDIRDGEGKAGLRLYTEAALRSGIVGMLAMPNESVRLPDRSQDDATEVEAYPIANKDRVLAAQSAIVDRAVIPTGLYMGLDPNTDFWEGDRKRLNATSLSAKFGQVKDECLGLKVYLGETTGSYHIDPAHAAGVARLWHLRNPEKPIVFHVEGPNIARLFRETQSVKISRNKTLPQQLVGDEIPVHIAHVSSRQELQAVINAKDDGMNVTCEVTPHHLSLDETVREELGGYGCMVPGLKTQEDIDFLWDNLDYIDIFASDCAPHRIVDKEGDNPAYGITNHTIMLPFLLGAVDEGKLTREDIYEKFCIAPRKRFGLPVEDGSFTEVSLAPEHALSTACYDSKAEYGQNPYVRTKQRLHLLGEVVCAQAGVSSFSLGANRPTRLATSYSHLLRPKNLK